MLGRWCSKVHAYIHVSSALMLQVYIVCKQLRHCQSIVQMVARCRDFPVHVFCALFAVP